jgi:competence protein ComEA
MQRKLIGMIGALLMAMFGLMPGVGTAASVDINSADARTLDRVLIGVGPAKAEAIIEYRKKNGPFGSADDLVKVRGIGPKTVEKNRSRIRVDGANLDHSGSSLSESDQATEPRPMIYRTAPTPRW